jgi:uncharacterized membrane protein YqhA
MNDRQRQLAIKVFMELLVGATVFFYAAARMFIKLFIKLFDMSVKIMDEVLKNMHFGK